MPLFDQAALNDGVKKREVFGWAMYDFANSGYTTVVLTAVFNAYFVGVIAGKADWATLAWTLALGLSSALVMLVMPALGAFADLRAAKKRLLAMSTIACVATTAVLALTGRGDVALAVAAIVLSNLFYSIGESLTAAFLPELARREALGKVSGWGWSFGYFGGMLSLGLSLGYVTWAQGQGQPATQFVPVTMLITAAVYGVASLATFALLRERALPQRAADGIAASAWLPDLARAVLPAFSGCWPVRCLPGRHRGGHCAGRGVRRTGAGIQAGADDDAGLPGQHRGGARRLRLRLLAGPQRAQACAGCHAHGLDRDDGDRGLGHDAGAVLGRP
jgi:UMF1 family MFS transporter